MHVVYAHESNSEIFYIGSGREQRAFNKTPRNKLWVEYVNNNPEYLVKILHNNLSKEESSRLEQNLISELKPPCNVKTKDTPRLDVCGIKHLFYVDTTSPSGLRYSVSNKGTGKNKRFAGDIAGGKKYQTDGRPHAWQVFVNGRAYLVHRIIYSIAHSEPIKDPNLVIDHIDRNPFNNLIENLRLVTYADNNLNSGQRPTRGHYYKPYLWTSTKANVNYWVGTTRVDNKRISKYFSIQKLGATTAQQMALLYCNS